MNCSKIIFWYSIQLSIKRIPYNYLCIFSWPKALNQLHRRLTKCVKSYSKIIDEGHYWTNVWVCRPNFDHLVVTCPWIDSNSLKLKHFIGQPMGAGFTNINTGSHTKQCTMEYKHMYIHSVIRTTGICICEIGTWPFCYYHNYHNYGESLY